ncbi:MAG: GAF domain-containing protein [Actinomycetota bacterium]|nr:GAF domain-containing protein [Actinomycetota bacterium]
MAFGGRLRAERFRRLIRRGRPSDDYAHPNGGEALPAERGPHENGQDAERRAALEVAQQQVRLRMPEVYVYPLVVENAHDVVTLFDRSGRIYYASPSWMDSLGYAPDDAIGTSAAELVHPEDQAVLAAMFERPAAEGRSLVEVRLRHSEGHWVVLELSAGTVRDNGGADLILTVGRDVTERHRAEEDRHHRLVEAETTARSEVEEAQRQLAAQFSVARTLGAAETLEDAAPEILRHIGENLGWDMGALWRVDEREQLLRCVELWRSPAAHAPEFERVTRTRTFRPGIGLPGRAWAASQPVWMTDVTTDSSFTRGPEADQAALHGGVAFPILLGAHVMGVLELFSRDIREPDQALLAILSATGAQVGQFIQRREAEAERAQALERERAIRRKADEATAQLRKLQTISDAALAHLSLDDLLHELLLRVRDALAADTAAVLLLTPDERELVLRAVSGGEEEAAKEPVRVAVGEGFAGRIAAERKPRIINEVVDADAVAGVLRGTVSSLVGVPLVAGDRLIGVLRAATVRPHAFGNSDVQLLELAAIRAAVAIENARLYEAEQEARRNALRAASRTVVLQAVTAALSEAITVSDVVRVVLERGSAVLGATAGLVAMLEEDGATLSVIGATGYPADLIERWRTIPMDQAAPLTEAVRTGKPVFVESRTEWESRYPNLVPEIVAGGNEAWATVPLLAKGGAVGALGLSFGKPRELTDDEVAFMVALARQCSQAIERARLYEEQTHVAETLQKSLLPPTFPDIPGFEVAARYRPAGRGIEVGGDFYDLFEARDGAWAVMIGDVCGKGPEAAVLTALVRYTVRAAAMHEDRPSRILGQLNEAVLRQVTDNRFCTVCYVRLRPNDGGARLTVCAGGHPLPLLLRAGGDLETVGRPGRLLGVFPEVDLTDEAADMRPGDALVLYTDGVTEEGRNGDHFGLERLGAAIRRARGQDAVGIVEAVEDAVVEFRPEAPMDDIAILVVRAEPA